jgi:histidinol-phosphatase (PHP family)
MYSAFHAKATHLKSIHASKITLLIGMETESIHAQTHSEIISLAQSFPLDYLVASVHHVQGIPIDFDETMYANAEATLGSTEALFESYFDSQLCLLQQIHQNLPDLPVVVGHFDLVRMFRPGFALNEEMWTRIRRNVDYISAKGFVVEINSRAWKKGLKGAYPLPDILDYMVRRGDVLFTLSDDSHGPKDVGMHYGLLVAYLKEFGVRDVWFPKRVVVTGRDESGRERERGCERGCEREREERGGGNNEGENSRFEMIRNVADDPFWSSF